MGRRIRITAIRRERPEIRLYVLALLALARQLQEQEEAQNKSQERPGAGDVPAPELPQGGADE